MAIVTAYDVYLECCEGEMDATWKNRDPVDFYTFRDVLSKQMCEYDPKKKNYPGDDKMRYVTGINNKRKIGANETNNNNKKAKKNSNGSLTLQAYKAIKMKRPQRICQDLGSYEEHVSSIVTTKNPTKCAVCSAATYKKCGVCGVPLHHMDIKGAGKGKMCSLHWHNDTYLGLCFEDRKAFSVAANDWQEWTDRQLKANEKVVKGYRKK